MADPLRVTVTCAANGDRTVTVECRDANLIRSELAYYGSFLHGDTAEPSKHEADLSGLESYVTSKRAGRGRLILAMGAYLHEQGMASFSRPTLSRCYGALPGKEGRRVAQATLSGLVKKGQMKRVARGQYAVTPEGMKFLHSVTSAARRAEPRSKTVAPAMTIKGIGKFLRALPDRKGWRYILAVAYFLQRSGFREFSTRNIENAFRAARFAKAPKQVNAALVGKLKKVDYVRSISHGKYQLSPRALRELEKDEHIQAGWNAHGSPASAGEKAQKPDTRSQGKAKGKAKAKPKAKAKAAKKKANVRKKKAGTRKKRAE